jgi:hypothetical protein
LAGALETERDGRSGVVPFAADKGRVTGAAEGGGPRFVAREFFVDVKQRAPGEQHRARGDAGRAVHAALHVGVIEGDAAPREAVKVGRLNVRVAEGGDRIGALVVSENEQHVGRSGGRGGETQSPSENEQRDDALK